MSPLHFGLYPVLPAIIGHQIDKNNDKKRKNSPDYPGLIPSIFPTANTQVSAAERFTPSNTALQPSIAVQRQPLSSTTPIAAARPYMVPAIAQSQWHTFA